MLAVHAMFFQLADAPAGYEARSVLNHARLVQTVFRRWSAIAIASGRNSTSERRSPKAWIPSRTASIRLTVPPGC